MASLEPQGNFIALDGGKPIGIATCISFGSVGWFGNLIVKEQCRSKGVGCLLVKHAVDYLQSKGTKAIGLYAYPQLVNFYSNLGFKKDENFFVLRTETVDSVVAGTLPKVAKPQIRAIEKFDSRCFGGDRKKLLESIILEKGNLSFYATEDAEVIGYVASTVYETMAWIGPLMCKANNIDAAKSLLNAVLAKLSGKTVYAALPKKEIALTKLFFDAGFKEDFSVVRMFFGEVPVKNCIYLAESLERG
jgi:predicted N-acetyltransferase YhbS